MTAQTPFVHALPLIAHLDADCFYVSCERLRFPSLRKKPTAVLGNQGACIIAKSYELKHRGIPTGLPIWEAIKIAPDAIYVKRDFYWYEVLSRKIHTLLTTLSATVEYYSIDECFFDASPLPVALNTYCNTSHASSFIEAALQLKDSVMKDIGIPVSIGISHTKILAKLCSKAAKPFGCRVAITKDQIKKLLAKRPVTDITGIATRSAARLSHAGIFTCNQFVASDRKHMRTLLTKKGEDLWWELHGTMIYPLNPKRVPHKVIARGGSIGKASSDKIRLTGWISRNTERLSEALQKEHVMTTKIGLALSWNGGGASDATTLTAPTADSDILFDAARQLFERIWGEKHVRYMHLLALSLVPKDQAPLTLFSHENSQKAHRPSLTAIRTLVNTKHGRFAVRSALTIPLKDIYHDAANAYDICDIHGKTCF